MTKIKSTKRALLGSALALLVCVSMLIGSTFAWFTDSVTSSGNKIQAGTLNIDMLVKDENGVYQSVKDNKAPIFTDGVLWEPGYTEWRNIKVSTTGNLALKYQMNIAMVGETSALADVIDVYYAASEITKPSTRSLDGLGLTRLGTLSEIFANNTAGALIQDTLIPGSNSEDFATIVLKMQESAGNQYQGLSIGAFDINIAATQLTYEKDSFDDQYDKDAWHPEMIASVADAQELLAAVNSGKNKIVLNNNIVADESITIPAGKKVTLNLNGKTLSVGNSVIKAFGAGTELVVQDINGGGKITTEATNAAAVFLKNGAKFTLESGTLSAKTYAVAMGYGDTADTFVMNGGSVIGTDYAISCSNKAGANIIINGGEIAATEKTGLVLAKGTLTVNGGTITSDASEHAALMTNGQYDDTDITINGGTIIGAGAGIYYPSAGNLKINGGSITGEKMAVNMKSGSLEITGGTLNGKTAEALMIENIGDEGYQQIGDVLIKGGTFTGKTEAVKSVDAGAAAKTGFIIGGTFNTNPSAYIADGYVVTENSDGTWTVGAKKVASGSELSSAISSGKAVELTEDVSNFATNITKDADINLAGNTLALSGSDLKVSGDLAVSGGTVDVTNGYFDLRSTENKEIVFENVVFANTKKSLTYGNSTDRVEPAIEFCPETAGVESTIIFRNCTFNNTNVTFEAMSGMNGAVNAVFEECSFNNLGNSDAIEISNYLTVNMTIKDCKFNMIATSNICIVDASSSSDVTLTFEGTNTVYGETAVATDASVKGTVDEIRIFSTQSVKVVSAAVDHVNGLDTVTVSGIASK